MVIDEVLQYENFPKFSFRLDNLNDIKGILILIQNESQTLVLYKQHYPIFLYKKDSSFSLKRLGNSTRFTKLNDDIIRINSNFDFF